MQVGTKNQLLGIAGGEVAQANRGKLEKTDKRHMQEE